MVLYNSFLNSFIYSVMSLQLPDNLEQENWSPDCLPTVAQIQKVKDLVSDVMTDFDVRKYTQNPDDITIHFYGNDSDEIDFENYKDIQNKWYAIALYDKEKPSQPIWYVEFSYYINNKWWHEVRINEIAIAENYQWKWYARYLLSQIDIFCREKLCQIDSQTLDVTLSFNAENERLKKIYEAQWFEEYAFKRSYGVPIIDMKKSIEK